MHVYFLFCMLLYRNTRTNTHSYTVSAVTVGLGREEEAMQSPPFTKLHSLPRAPHQQRPKQLLEAVKLSVQQLVRQLLHHRSSCAALHLCHKLPGNNTTNTLSANNARKKEYSRCTALPLTWRPVNRLPALRPSHHTCPLLEFALPIAAAAASLLYRVCSAASA